MGDENMSKEAMHLAAAFKRSSKKQKDVAAAVGVSDGLMWQWLHDRRPVPPDKAVRLAQELNTDPRRISAKYAAVSASEPGNVALLRKENTMDDQRDLGLIIARLENDVDSLRYAMASLIAVMAVHRPAEGADVAKAIRKHVPARFVKQGFLPELLKALDDKG